MEAKVYIQLSESGTHTQMESELLIKDTANWWNKTCWNFWEVGCTYNKNLNLPEVSVKEKIFANFAKFSSVKLPPAHNKIYSIYSSLSGGEADWGESDRGEVHKPAQTLYEVFHTTTFSPGSKDAVISQTNLTFSSSGRIQCPSQGMVIF